MANETFGAAKSDGFLLNEATLMLGELGSYKDLTVAKHSIGLFKDMAVVNNRTFTPLKQGIRQKIVANTLTSDSWTITGKGFEYGTSQLLYALGQEGFNLTPAPTSKFTSTTTSAQGTSTVTLDSATGIAAGDYLIYENQVGQTDGLVYKITDVSATAPFVVTLDRPLVGDIAVGDQFAKSMLISTQNASCNGATYLSGKIVSKLNNCEPIVIWLPKVQVTSGLSLNFGASDYSSIPYTLETLALTSSDAGYADWLAMGEDELLLAKS